VTSLPRFLDFEASSLASNSYPIEVAWSDGDGRLEAHLIDPSSVSAWTDWSDESQAVHGIRRDTLVAEGRDPGWVCDRLSAEAGGQKLYSDAAPFDRAWLVELFRGAGRSRPSIRVASIQALPELARLDDATLARLQHQARLLAGGQHRAGKDVMYLLHLYRLAREAGGA